MKIMTMLLPQSLRVIENASSLEGKAGRLNLPRRQCPRIPSMAWYTSRKAAPTVVNP